MSNLCAYISFCWLSLSSLLLFLEIHLCYRHAISIQVQIIIFRVRSILQQWLCLSQQHTTDALHTRAALMTFFARSIAIPCYWLDLFLP
ncbi:hypothetical protein FGO68_gene643 [Halteria grandinella]|uniref:Secreted protein n=1 Tax=Halteria grandinella TaxID=5974 RepID=A0A8J8NMW7_HALGN|nr:hypothetical protein FGO68_gene643 [Halteria grandinella]